MFDGLLVHPQTRRELEAYIVHQPHALLFIGPIGAGKLTLARIWAKAVNAQHVQVVAPEEKGGVSIDAIRGLYPLTRGKRHSQQVVIIDHAEVMSIEAQNAFLKLLEEPPERVTFILTVPTRDAVLPTILSRTQHVTVQPLPANELRAFIAARGALSATDAEQVLFIANGRPAIAAQLLAQPELLAAQRTLTLQAKELLAAKRYDRLIQLNDLTTDRERCVALLEMMLRMASLQLKKPDAGQAKHWLVLCQTLERALTRLAHNAHLKTQLLQLFTSY